MTTAPRRRPRFLLPLLATAGILSLGALALAASPTPRSADRPIPGRHLGRFGHGEAITRLLVLDTAQSAKATELVARLRSDLAPIRDSRRTTRERLRTELESARPNAETIGRLVLDSRSSRGAVRSALERFDQDLSAMLRPEQLTRYKEWKDRRFRHRGGDRLRERFRGHSRDGLRGGPDGPPPLPGDDRPL